MSAENEKISFTQPFECLLKILKMMKHYGKMKERLPFEFGVKSSQFCREKGKVAVKIICAFERKNGIMGL